MIHWIIFRALRPPSRGRLLVRKCFRKNIRKNDFIVPFCFNLWRPPVRHEIVCKHLQPLDERFPQLAYRCKRNCVSNPIDKNILIRQMILFGQPNRLTLARRNCASRRHVEHLPWKKRSAVFTDLSAFSPFPSPARRRGRYRPNPGRGGNRGGRGFPPRSGGCSRRRFFPPGKRSTLPRWRR